MSSNGVAEAQNISITDVLSLLDGRLHEFASGVSENRYGLWLGSGISRSRVPPLGEVTKKVLLFLQGKITPDANCQYRESLNTILSLAGLSEADRASIDLDQAPDTWAPLNTIVTNLCTRYAQMLDQAPRSEAPDYLVWEAVQVAQTYGDPTLKPTTEHLCIAALILEGIFSDIATANWDGLVEEAVKELSGNQPILRIVVRPEDAQQPPLVANFFKFHGCAVCALADEGVYRPLIIARQTQITGWAGRNPIMAAKLADMATSKPTLMLGLSAQDANIQEVFAQAQQSMTWPWPSHPPAYVFSEALLGVDQRSLLANVYSAHFNAANRQAIFDSAIVRAFAAPLLVGLWLDVLFKKFSGLTTLVTTLAQPDRNLLIAGLKTLRDTSAATCQAGSREDFLRRALALITRGLDLFRYGDHPSIGGGSYAAISAKSGLVLLADPLIPASGLKELSVALGLIGLNVTAGHWQLGVSSATETRPAPLKLTTADGRTAKVFFAANAHSAMHLFNKQNVLDTDDAIIIHSHEIIAPMQRSPTASLGRSGLGGCREVSIASLLAESGNAAFLQRRLSEEAGL